MNNFLAAVVLIIVGAVFFNLILTGDTSMDQTGKSLCSYSVEEIGKRQTP